MIRRRIQVDGAGGLVGGRVEGAGRQGKPYHFTVKEELN
jgi:hypothetical protein